MTQLPREKKASSKQGKVTVDAHFFMFAHHNSEPVITEVAYIATLCCVLIEKCEVFFLNGNYKLFGLFLGSV